MKPTWRTNFHFRSLQDISDSLFKLGTIMQRFDWNIWRVKTWYTLCWLNWLSCNFGISIECWLVSCKLKKIAPPVFCCFFSYMLRDSKIKFSLSSNILLLQWGKITKPKIPKTEPYKDVTWECLNSIIATENKSISNPCGLWNYYLYWHCVFLSEANFAVITFLCLAYLICVCCCGPTAWIKELIWITYLSSI